MTQLRFPLDAAEIETYHRDGVLGPYRLVSPDLMAPMRERIMAEIITPGAHDDDPDVHDVDATRTSFHQAVPTDAIDPAEVRAFELEPGEFVLFSENTLHRSGPNRTADQRIALTPPVTVPFVRVTGNPLYAGRDGARHAPDEPREVAILRGHDYTGRHHVVPLPCPRCSCS